MIQERKITLEAASIDDALAEASRQLKLPIEELKAEVVSSEREGLFGLFGAKKLMIEVTASARQDLTSRGLDFVNDILKLMDFEAEAVISEAEKNTLEITGNDALDYVVGRYGDALRGMEYIVNLALRDPKNEPRLKIDSCGYRARRTKSLERLAEATARQAVKFGRPIRLDPMASWERWVIHTTLKDRDDVTTESVGEPPMRKVVIMPKYDPDNMPTLGPATMRIRAQRERSRQNNNNNLNSQRRFRR
ncbi:MAG: Jag N-terminal domain-containing protein [Synergistaceae bacterium]|nr:Jag N-terminal domain-containing protein [Synergistaceae bacterium]